MKIEVHLQKYLAVSFLDGKIFQIRVAEEIKHIFYVEYIISEYHVVYEVFTKHMVETTGCA